MPSVQKAACWMISSGLNLNIWDEPWIPNIEGFKPTPHPSLPSLPNFNISDLFSYPSRGWNTPLILFLFDALTASKILDIHLLHNPSPDLWSWIPSPTGRFSVKSAYEMINPLSSSTISPLCPSDWKLLWSLKIQFRLKHFLWKLAWNILPIRPNIFRFLYQQDPDMLCCPLCQLSVESLQHIFLSCPLSRIMWQNSLWPLHTVSFSYMPFVDWIKALLRPHFSLGIPVQDVHNFQISALVLMDQIWFARNKLIHEAITPVPLTTLKCIKNTAQHHLLA
jgi:hypothetical protein